MNTPFAAGRPEKMIIASPGYIVTFRFSGPPPFGNLLPPPDTLNLTTETAVARGGSPFSGKELSERLLFTNRVDSLSQMANEHPHSTGAEGRKYRGSARIHET